MACIREYDGTCAGILTIIRRPPSGKKIHSQAGKNVYSIGYG
jgi:hypothetical protein